MELTHESNGKVYGFQTKEVGAGWNGDTGFRHRVVCEDGRHSGWASYTQVSYLDDVACVSPYFHDTHDMRLVTLAEAMAFIAIGEAAPGSEVEGFAGDDVIETDGDEMRELSKHPTHIWFPGSKLKNKSAAKFELCWITRSDADGVSFGDLNGNEYCTVSDVAVPNEHGSIVLELGDFVLVLDDVNQFWGTGPNLESAIKAMPNGMEDLPHTCVVYVSDQPMTVTENGCIKGSGASVPVQVLRKEGRKVTPVMPK